jgi:hypothetical protein
MSPVQSRQRQSSPVMSFQSLGFILNTSLSVGDHSFSWPDGRGNDCVYYTLKIAKEEGKKVKENVLDSSY